MDLPLAYYVLPKSSTPGRLGVIFDLEANRMLEPSGLCSLRLRTPCEWDGVFYQAVGAVEPVPVLSGAGAGGPVTWDPGCRVPVRLQSACSVSVSAQPINAHDLPCQYC